MFTFYQYLISISSFVHIKFFLQSKIPPIYRWHIGGILLCNFQLFNYSYNKGLISSASILVLSYQWKPVSIFFGNVSPFIALTAASTAL